MWNQTRIALVLLAMAAPAAAAVASHGPRRLALDMSCKLVQDGIIHAPVVLECAFENHSIEPLALDLGWNAIGHFELTLSRPGESPSRVRPSIKGLGGLARVGKITLAPGALHTQRILLNEWFEFPRPGSYDLIVNFDGAVTTMAGDAVVLQRVHSLLFVLRPPVPGEMNQIADSLLKKATMSVAVADRLEALQSLSYMRDPAAIPYLRRLVALRLWPGVAIEGIERAGTEDAVVALRELAESKDPDTARQARASLARLESAKK